MKRLISLVSVFLIIGFGCSLAAGQASAQPTAKDSATTTGKTIGTIISSAIDTVFPIIGKIKDLLFKPSDNANATTTKAKVDTAAQKTTQDAKASFMTKLQPLIGIANELKVITAFAKAGSGALKNVETISVELNQSAVDADKLKLEWDIACNYLSPVTLEKLDDIREEAIKVRCRDLQDAHNDLYVRILAGINAVKDKKPNAVQDLKPLIVRIKELLKGFDTIAAIELDTLQNDIDSLGKWANGPAGPSLLSVLTQPDKELLAILDSSIARARSHMPVK
jgi:hypothetical protein